MAIVDDAIERTIGRFGAGLLNLRHVDYFLVICEEMHFGRSSRRLNVAQPALSQQIKRLEAYLGVSLFNRNRRGIELTEAGAVFRAHALRLTKQIEEAKWASRRAAQGESGKISVGLVPSGNHLFVLERLAQFNRGHPAVEVLISSMTTAEQIEAVVAGKLDVGVVRLPVRHHDIEQTTIFAEEMVVALPRDHKLARAPRIRMADLALENLIAFPRDVAPSYFDYIVSLFRMAGHELKITQQISHIPTMFALIASGFGFTLAPASQEGILEYKGVVFRPLAEKTPLIELGLIRKKDNASALVASFLALFPECGRASR